LAQGFPKEVYDGHRQDPEKEGEKAGSELALSQGLHPIMKEEVIQRGIWLNVGDIWQQPTPRMSRKPDGEGFITSERLIIEAIEAQGEG